MATKEIRPLRDTSNTALFNAIRNDASSDYQRRIPEATKAGISDTIENLHLYRPQMNEFMDSLVNRIGTQIGRNESWNNPLAVFKRGLLSFGDTIEEVATGLVKSHTYSADREHLERDIFGTHALPSESNFHRINRQEWYPITVNELLLKRAFLEPGGIANFISQIMQAPVTSDSWDEFLATCQLIAEYESNGGFYHVNVPNVIGLNSTEADAKAALRKMRAMADTLPFLSTKYNAAKMPVFAKRDELVLLCSPEFTAAVDVNALAAAFNRDDANMHGRVVTIPQENFGVDGCQAILTTEDFFVIADNVLENTSQPNPVGLGVNYFLHHWQIISASRFAPAVMFWTGADDGAAVVVNKIASLAGPTIEAKDGIVPTSAPRGELTAFVVTGTTTLGETVHNPVKWSITGSESARTWIEEDGVLHVAGDEPSASITVVAETTWIDPANVTDVRIVQLVVPVTGDQVPDWPASEETTPTP